MNDNVLRPELWAPRSSEDTKKVYADWADTYDADVLGSGYATPHRIAHALTTVTNDDALILDVGCGTGLAGMALHNAGFHHVDGIDLSPEMLQIAKDRAIYREAWLTQAGELTDVMPGLYTVIVAAGVISLGAAPADTMELCLDHLDKDGLLAMSFNDPTLDDGSYEQELQKHLDAKTATQIFREYGPHLPAKDMGSDVIILRKL
ncbi:MAG: class I SAM-dependent DNA methyltransferase [Planktomarina sp.]